MEKIACPPVQVCIVHAACTLKTLVVQAQLHSCTEGTNARGNICDLYIGQHLQMGLQDVPGPGLQARDPCGPGGGLGAEGRGCSRPRQVQPG